MAGLLLYGCNGVGKTSWVDAIEKPLTGRCSSVETGDQAVSWTKHGTHIRATEPSVVLVLTDGAKNYEVTLNTDPVTLPAPVRKLLTAAKQYGFILRRRTLLDFILAKPQDRYKAIQGFLNLDEYAAFERKLKDLKLTVDARGGVCRISDST
jgi:predicted ABC-type ATPase